MMTYRTYSEAIFTDQARNSIKNLLLIIGSSLLISLCAQISFQIPFTPVPFAMANLCCLVLGATLGPNRGALAVLTYLFYGSIGLPVFAAGSSIGLAHLTGPRGGYLLGYVAGAYLVGHLVQRMRKPNASKILFALSAGNLCIWLLGALQLSFFIGMPSAIMLGVAPFLVTDTLKCVFVCKGLRRFINLS